MLRNMRITVITIVVNAFRTVSKSKEKKVEKLEISWRVKIIQASSSALVRILTRDLMPHSDSSERPTAINAVVKKLAKSKIIIIIKTIIHEENTNGTN